MSSTQKNWTILKILNWTTGHFEQKGFEHPRLNAELLLANVLHCRRIDLYLKFEEPVKSPEIGQFKEYLQRRLNHEPIQYILGETEFYGLKFKVTPDVLIPRPETELLVEKTLELAKNFLNPSVMDIGTGSGVIAVSLAVKGNYRIVAIDQSERAIQIALENAKFHQVDDKIQFMKLDVLEESNKLESFHFDILVSNPPYGTSRELLNLPPEIKRYEPIQAIRGGEDGILFYRQLVTISRTSLNPGGWLAVEINDEKASILQELFQKAGFREVQCFKDYSKLDRIIIGKKPNQYA